ncbi:MAG: ATP-binding protein [Desulfovibrionales bacterium]|nr:MAG: ATP-binding protein [Desulfovibrionales bacterium]
MALTNHERVGKAMELLRQGLGPFVEREVQARIKTGAVNMETIRRFADDPMLTSKPIVQWDASGQLRLMWETWNDIFKYTLGFAERSLVSELRDWRNKWAHQEPFSSDDADRALDSMARLLAAVSAPQADAVGKMKMELRRLIFDEQVRGQKRKAGGGLVEASFTALKPWREVITPHKDVASGRYQQAEFAADLWQVHLGEGTKEYLDPREFFRRTFITDSLRLLLIGALLRISGQGGDPVIQLQTNFGGGKTHTMLALLHLFSGIAPGELDGIDAVMLEAGMKIVPKARCVVLVGNKISPGNPVTKEDGTVVRTLWGELAWQLGGREAFQRIQEDDKFSTSPGDVLRQLLKDYGPCLILIDEWVAYARQLHDASDLPGGSFETQFSFAQVLTESAKLAGNCLLVVSLPASDTGGSPHTKADDVEVGGIRGREALDRLRNVVGRIESSWRPASAEEGFEIVRRRLFEPLMGTNAFKHRDVAARAFVDLYRAQSAEFPPECRDSDYEKRIQAAYPIHPEVFDRLYTDWSTLVKFQRTRGVLRLMAAVIHSLWEKGDRSPLIMPSTIPIDDPRVQFELTRYLSDNWLPIIEKDVDGTNSLPLKIDAEVPNLGKHSATRRVARTIYLGSAPTAGAAHQGVEDRRVRLGCVVPGETPAVFGDALRRLANTATYLYQDGSRYWYSTQPTVTKLAEDRAEQYKRNPDPVVMEMDKRLRADLRNTGDFNKIHPLPKSGQDVPDDTEARLVVLGPDAPHTKDAESKALAAAKAILEFRGNTPRLLRNTLVFLAVDQARLQDLDESVRRYLAWQSILDERESLDLSPHQVRQAETQLKSADSTVSARLPEAYLWLLVPSQPTPQSPLTWQTSRLTGQDALAVRVSKKLKGDELLITAMSGTMLRMDMDKIPLWRDAHVSIRQLVEDYARYPYLPRLRDSGVLAAAARDGVGLMTWEVDSFAYADGYDEAAGRYQGLRCFTQRLPITPEDPGLLVKPQAAREQLKAELEKTGIPHQPGSPNDIPMPPQPGDDLPHPNPGDPAPSQAKTKRRFHGTVTLNPKRTGSDAGRVAEEIIAHLDALQGANVRVTLEIEADIPTGVPDNVIRIVTENSRALKFESQGFEEE